MVQNVNYGMDDPGGQIILLSIRAFLRLEVERSEQREPDSGASKASLEIIYKINNAPTHKLRKP